MKFKVMIRDGSGKVNIVEEEADNINILKEAMNFTGTELIKVIEAEGQPVFNTPPAVQVPTPVIQSKIEQPDTTVSRSLEDLPSINTGIKSMIFTSGENEFKIEGNNVFKRDWVYIDNCRIVHVNDDNNIKKIITNKPYKVQVLDWVKIK